MTIGFPQYNVPPIDLKTGRWSREWWLFLQLLWQKTGANQASISFSQGGNAHANELESRLEEFFQEYANRLAAPIDAWQEPVDSPIDRDARCGQEPVDSGSRLASLEAYVGSIPLLPFTVFSVGDIVVIDSSSQFAGLHDVA